MKRLRPRTMTRDQAANAVYATRCALRGLIYAREHLKHAGAPKTLERVRLAISSCKGAIRAARGRVHDEVHEAVRRAHGTPESRAERGKF